MKRWIEIPDKWVCTNTTRKTIRQQASKQTKAKIKHTFNGNYVAGKQINLNGFY